MSRLRNLPSRPAVAGGVAGPFSAAAAARLFEARRTVALGDHLAAAINASVALGTAGNRRDGRHHGSGVGRRIDAQSTAGPDAVGPPATTVTVIGVGLMAAFGRAACGISRSRSPRRAAWRAFDVVERFAEAEEVSALNRSLIVTLMLHETLSTFALIVFMLVTRPLAADRLVEGVPLPGRRASGDRRGGGLAELATGWRLGRCLGGTLKHVLLVESVAAGGSARVVYAVGDNLVWDTARLVSAQATGRRFHRSLRLYFPRPTRSVGCRD